VAATSCAAAAGQLAVKKNSPVPVLVLQESKKKRCGGKLSGEFLLRRLRSWNFGKKKSLVSAVRTLQISSLAENNALLFLVLV
jgi:hypothetical protein